MAAVRSPMMPSPSNNLMSSFSPYTDSPSSPAGGFGTKRSSTDSTGHLQPHPQKSPLLSPSDICDPSPILSSNGTDVTDTTDIDDTAMEQPAVQVTIEEPDDQSRPDEKVVVRIETKDPDGNDFKPPSPGEDNPPSVIHAPEGFNPFNDPKRSSWLGRTTPTPSQRSDVTVISPNEELRKLNGPQSPPPISTAIPPMRDSFNTPRAQTRQEAEALEQERALKLKSNSLEDIPEAADVEGEETQETDTGTPIGPFSRHADEISALRLALSECWTLCNTLASLSSIHRRKYIHGSPSLRQKGDDRERAWRACWTLCQRLYETWDEDHSSAVSPTLDLCRAFCQDLFEVRQRENDIGDSVLRVSFELNNHLYNTHDRALPEAFRERTLDFYITLCHRLMKQRSKMMEETDSLLRACWSLAEMLFSLRQNKREGNHPDEELLGSAVQACWELCDLFREGWTQVRPDRGTPRPSQTSFMQAFQQAKQTDKASNIAPIDEEYPEYTVPHLPPETPTTIFDDSAQSPDEATVPNIIVLGPDAKARASQQWSSSSSTLSGYSESSKQTSSSTSTIINPAEDPRLTCLKLLIVKAAINLGFQRGDGLPSFVKTLPTNSFGTKPWEMRLLESYRQLVATDPTFRSPGPPRRASAPDVARSVQWMLGTRQYPWLEDLFRWVFGFRIMDAAVRPGVTIQS